MNETILKVIKQEDYDRYVFLFYKNNEIIGINFHQGIDKIEYDFAEPCPHLSEIFKRLTYHNDKYASTDWDVRVNKSIAIYIRAFIFNDADEYISVDKINEIKTDLNNILKKLNY